MNKKKLIFVGAIANIFEWYDYALFGLFAPIISMKFFPDDDPNVALLNTFLVFALGYLVRPLGGIFFGVIGDKFGRKKALSSAIMCMAFPTAAIGFIPTYQTWGLSSTILIIIVRMLQGLSMGGALTGSVSFTIEHSEEKHKGLIGSIPMASICAGILLGSLVSFIIKNSLSSQAFNDWGWRIPFMLGIMVFFAGIYIKNNTQETPLFEDLKQKNLIIKSPVKYALVNHWSEMLISIFINATGSIIFYLEAIYLTTYLKLNRNFSDVAVTYLVNSCYIIMIFATIFAGWLSDRIGRKKIFTINIISIILLSSYLLQTFETASFSSVIFAYIIIAILAAFYIGPEPALQAELFPTNVRNTALSISYNIATSLFGGTAPYIIESLVQNTGTITSGVYYITSAGCLSLIALYFYKRA